MTIKDIFFSTVRFLSILILFVFIHSAASNGLAQITSGNVNPEEKKQDTKKEKKEKPASEPDSLTGTNFYLSGLYQYSYRSFEDNSPTKDYYAEWQQHTAAYNGGVSAGVIMELSKLIHLDIGITYFGHSEKYSYQDSLTDSTFSYKNTYAQIALPLRLRVVYGDKFQVYGFAGVAPLNILKLKYESSYTTENGIAVEREDEIKTDGFSTFNLMLTAGFGLNYNLNRIGFFLAPEYRRHLLNTYSDKIISMDHRMYSIGINAGMILKF
ncbi:MAG: outer membrane beta-barrel protein [Crocinitomicaceae bacterium]|nr:outer membrane beta-barrel protein [Crocinitomicaceae bacterium]